VKYGTINVADANAVTRPIHDRIPVVLDKVDIALWLSGTAGAELSGASTRPAPVMMIPR